jgi:hypothetical protein
MISPEYRPSFHALLSTASSRVTTAALALVLMSGTVLAQQQPQASQPQAAPPATQQPGDGATPGAVPQHGGAVPQTDRAPDLSLDDGQRAALRKAVLARHTAQKPVPDFTPEAGATAPRALKLESMPPEIVQQIPALRHFLVADIANRQALIVNGMDRKIVAVIVLTDDTASATPPAAGDAAKSDIAKADTHTARDDAAQTSKQVTETAREGAVKAPENDTTNDNAKDGSRAHIDKNRLHDDDGNDPHIEKSADNPPPTDTAVFRNGVLTVPGAPKNSETAPAKFSAVTAALDNQPTMSGGADLTAEQAAEVFRAVMADKSVQPATISATEPAAQLPNLTPAHPFPDALVQKFPALATYGYIKTSDKVLIVTPANKILVGWIDAKGQDPSSQPAEAAAAARGG